MIATQSKTRARAQKPALRAVPTAAQPATIDDIQRLIRMADQKLEDAYDAADRESPMDALLDHINHNLLTAPVYIISKDDIITQADVQRIRTGLVPVLACLQGAIKLAEKSALGGTLYEASQLLLAAQAALAPASEAVRALPEGGVATDFLHGRNLAIKLINDGSALSGERGCYRHQRDPGMAQNNFVSDCLLELMDSPELHFGFAAVLSQVIGSSEGFNGEFFEQLTLAETKAGPAGADGTRGEDGESTIALTPKLDFEATGIEENAYFMVNEVIEIIRSRQQDLDRDIVYGARYAVEYAYRILEAGVAARDLDECEDASGPLAAAISVLEAALQICDDVALHGALRLLAFAKESLDCATAKTMRTQVRA